MIYMLKYGVEFYEIVYPKWGKIRFKISTKGTFLFIMNPSLTPGADPGQAQKGKKMMDYDKNKECILSFDLRECMDFMAFAKKLSDNEFSMIHQFHGQEKILKMNWTENQKTGTYEFCNINYSCSEYVGATKKVISKIYMPVAAKGIQMIAAIINSYLTNYAFIKLYCLGDITTLIKAPTVRDQFSKNAQAARKALADNTDFEDFEGGDEETENKETPKDDFDEEDE